MSSFTWLAVDRRQHRQMMELVDQFRDASTVDDLGFGPIRDAWADRLFPGTSTLHTRIRYALFIPWLLRRAERKHTVDGILADFREGEFQLMGALRAGLGEDLTGVIGRDAGRALKRLPSVVYWGMLVEWGIVRGGHSAREHAERVLLEREAARHAPAGDDQGPSSRSFGHLDPRLPDAPPDLIRHADFTLNHEQADYLRTMISTHSPHSLLAHLLQHPPGTWASTGTLPDTLEELLNDHLPDRLHRTLSAAVRFSRLAHVANLVYNVMLADEAERTDDNGTPLAARHREWLGSAWEGYRAGESFRLDDLDLIHTPGRAPRPIRASDREFLDRWGELVGTSSSSDALADDSTARRLIEEREHRKKKQLARLRNRSRLDQWNGGSGLGRMEFRWADTRTHLQDLYSALEAD